MNSASSSMQVLADPNASLAAITSALAEARAASAQLPRIRLGIVANVTIDIIGTYLRRHGLLEGVAVEPEPGDYDNLIGNIERFATTGADAVLLVLLFDNLLPAFERQVDLLSDDEIAAKLEDLRGRLEVALGSGRSISRLVVVRFHRITRRTGINGRDRVDTAIDDYNAMLGSLASRHFNVSLIDVQDIITMHGARHCFDWRFYFRGKSPYSLELLDQLARLALRATRAFGTRFYKALVLDCDNTLWGGVVGEDLITGIKLDPFDYPGSVYWRIQNELLALQRQGVVLCIASKNNPSDVEAVLEAHPCSVLRSNHFVVKMLNWESKVDNLRQIALTLNIGLDSLVFLDDSSFECELVRGQLPMVRTFQVPKSLTDYPRILEEIRSLFITDSKSNGNATKTQQYIIRAAAESERASFASHSDYLASLEIKLTLAHNSRSASARISELTMKSNQFNLTTRRYTQAQILGLMDDPHCCVVSFSVSDRFGDSGLTGVIIVRRHDEVADVDTFLMSCRIIGRSIELAAWDHVVSIARAVGATVIEADYLPTAKNAQVAEFYDRVMAHPARVDNEGVRHYRAALNDIQTSAPSWIEVTHAQ